MFNIDATSQSVVNAITPASLSGSPSASVVDLTQFTGKVALILNVSASTAGTTPVISFQPSTSATNNVSNATNYGNAVATSNNSNAALTVIGIDTQATAGRYLFITPTLTGANAAFTCSAVVVGMKQVEPT